MKNKELQESRMRTYFLEATQEILKSEGLKALSVRSIADRAGYSYATLYNYFRDINELIFLCVEGFQAECREYTRQTTPAKASPRETLKAACMAYATYFTEYPGIFELFFLERMLGFGNNPETARTIAGSFGNATQHAFDALETDLTMTPEALARLRQTLRDTVLTSLLLYLNRRMPPDYHEFRTSLDNTLTHLLLQVQ